MYPVQDLMEEARELQLLLGAVRNLQFSCTLLLNRAGWKLSLKQKG